MSNAFQWTENNVAEFIQTRLHIQESASFDLIEQFKASKEPKKEWEVLAYVFEPLQPEKIVLVNQDDQHWTEAAEDKTGMYLPWAIKRTSDGEVFSVGDRIKPNAAHHTIVITQFTATENVLRVHNRDGYFLSGEQYWGQMQKAPAPVLTTVDGVDKYVSDPVFVIDDEVGIREWNLKEWDNFSEYKVLSTKEAAETYILNHRPLLSLNDVISVCENNKFYLPALVDKLTTLVKQKLNR